MLPRNPRQFVSRDDRAIQDAQARLNLCFNEILALSVFRLLTFVPSGYRAMVPHHPRPDFAARSFFFRQFVSRHFDSPVKCLFLRILLTFQPPSNPTQSAKKSHTSDTISMRQSGTNSRVIMSAPSIPSKLTYTGTQPQKSPVYSYCVLNSFILLISSPYTFCKHVPGL